MTALILLLVTAAGTTLLFLQDASAQGFVMKEQAGEGEAPALRTRTPGPICLLHLPARRMIFAFPEEP